MSNESIDEAFLRADLQRLTEPVGKALLSDAYAEEINLAAMRPEIERRKTFAGRIGYHIMRVVQYVRP